MMVLLVPSLIGTNKHQLQILQPPIIKHGLARFQVIFPFSDKHLIIPEVEYLIQVIFEPSVPMVQGGCVVRANVFQMIDNQ